jgi:predicted Zn-dependent peptidase
MKFRSLAPEAKTIKTLTFLPPQETHLSGGIPLIASPKRDLGVVKLVFYWPTGTAAQSIPMQARASQTLRLSGNKSHSSEQIQEGFEYLGASANPDVGLLSSTLVLQTQKQYLEEALKWLVEEGAEPVFPEHELAVFKQVETSSLQRRMQTPRYWSSRLCYESIYGKSSPDSSFADSENIDALTGEALGWWHTKHLSFSACRIFVSGDFGQDEHAVLERVMGSMAATRTTVQERIAATPAPPTQIQHPMEHAQQVSLYMGKALPKLRVEDLQTASFVNMFLGGFFGSRLMQDLRETRGLTYGIGSGLAQASSGFTWYISGEMNSANAEAAVEACKTIMTGLSTSPPTGDELEKARRYASGQLRAGFDGPFSLPSKWQFLLQNDLPKNYHTTYMNRIWSITSDEISEFAYNYLQPGSFSLALAGKLN